MTERRSPMKLAYKVRKSPLPSRPGLLDLPGYWQTDDYSCGFVAALTVVHFFYPEIPADEVLASVRPSPEAGCDAKRVVKALAHFGIDATYRNDLGPKRLHRLAGKGLPVIVTVWPEDYGCDHWTVVRGIDLDARRIFLCNYSGVEADGGMAFDDFAAIWFGRGEGVVCIPSQCK